MLSCRGGVFNNIAQPARSWNFPAGLPIIDSGAGRPAQCPDFDISNISGHASVPRWSDPNEGRQLRERSFRKDALPLLT